MFRWIKDLFFKCYNNRVLRYIFYGGLTTLVNLAVYYLLRLVFKVPMTPANVTSIICAILFAYFVNSRFVFETKAVGFSEHFIEFVKFCGARVSTLVIETWGVWFMASVLKINDLVGKVIIQFIVLALNYVFSRFLVFTRGRGQEKG